MFREAIKRKGDSFKTKALNLLVGNREGAALNEKSLMFGNNEKKASDISTRGLPNKAGLVIDYEKLRGGRERITCLTGDVHTLNCGATGSGKTRRMVIPTVCSLALAGESIVITDPKGVRSDRVQ